MTAAIEMPFGGPATTSFETILLATDLSRASAAATEHAVALAARLEARLLVVNVLDTHHGLSLGGRGGIRPVEEREARSLVARNLVDRARAAGAKATFLIWEGGAGDSIVAAAESEKADLIVMGTRGRAGMERSILGSVSDHVIRHAPCPVLVVRPQDD
jgi:nucleotide-binding universal stress UspA family protein